MRRPAGRGAETPLLAECVGYSYGRREALIGVDLRVERGDIQGLVGPNGSGKTTLMQLIAGLLRPREGRVEVFGYEPFRQREDVMRRARFAFAPPALFDGLTAREHLRFLARASGERPPRAEIDRVLDMVGLEARGADRVGTFSLGMRQRLALAQALLPTPELLVLDEPTDGLDPLGVLELREVLKRLRDESRVTVLLSSHLLVEVEHLVDSLLVLMEGRVEFSGAPSVLLREGRRTALRASGITAGELASALERADILVVSVEDEEVVVADGALELGRAAAIAGEAGGVLEAFHPRQLDLQGALLERQRARRAEEARS